MEINLYHMAYITSLVLSFMGTLDFVAIVLLGWTIYQLQRKRLKQIYALVACIG